MPFLRALLFDLDDTLFDTSTHLIPAAHREAALAMVQAGLEAPVEDVLQTRLELARTQPGEGLERAVAEAFGCHDPRVAEAGFKAFYHREVGPIQLEAEVEAMLHRLEGRFRLALVTAGTPQTQQDKVRALGLERFCRPIYYVDSGRGEQKEGALAAAALELGLAPAKCVVVGDRASSEIAAGRRLGMWTVRVQHGEHAGIAPTSREQQADITLEDVLDLEAALERLEDVAVKGGTPGGQRAGDE